MECICYEHKKCSFLLKQKELWYTNKERMMEMAKLVFLKEDVYENFVKQHPKSHFLQSYAWGEFAKVKKHLTPYYLGLIDDNKNILGTALLLQKHLPMNYCYFYCPRGYVINYEDENLVTEMTKKIVQFAKSKKAIFIKIDPDLIYKDYNYLEEEQTLPYDTNKIFELLKKLGYKHQGFTKNFETMQPRYTFRIDLTQSLEEIQNHFSKTTKQRKDTEKATEPQTSPCGTGGCFYTKNRRTHQRIGSTY